eukprot:s1270_g29.t1
MWKRFEQWLEWNRGYLYPRGVKDAIDYMQHRVNDGCGRTIPEALQASLSLIEQLGRVPDDARISEDSLWKGHVKSWTAELSEESPPKKPAEMYTVAMVLALELTVVDETEVLFARALAWVVLCMVWGAMRCDDVQAVLPHRTMLSNYGLRLVLGKSKTTGPDKLQKEVAVHVFRTTSLSGSDWLKVGYDLWSEEPFTFRRDYLVMEPNKEWTGVKRKFLPPASVSSAISKLLGSLCCPKRAYVGWELMPAVHLLPDGLESFFSGHSPRNFLTSVAATIGFSRDERAYLGRWSMGMVSSEEYVRTARQVVFKIQRAVNQTLVDGSGGPFFEDESIGKLVDFAQENGANPNRIRKRHSVMSTWTGKMCLGGVYPTLEVLQDDWDDRPGADSDQALSEKVASIAMKEKMVSSQETRYFITISRRTALRRLHLTGCFVKADRCGEVIHVNEVNQEDFDSICQACRKKMLAECGKDGGDQSSATASSSSTASDCCALRNLKFSALGDDRAAIRTCCLQDFAIVADSPENRSQIASVVAAWETAREFLSKEIELRAEAKALGQPRVLQIHERQAMLRAVEAVHGSLNDSECPASDYLSLKAEETESNERTAAPLDEILSKLASANSQIQSTVDGTGHIRVTRTKTKAKMPSTTEEYRKVMKVEMYAWLAMASRYKAKHWLHGLTAEPCLKFTEFILGDRVYGIQIPTNDGSQQRIKPHWTIVLAYEQKLRKEAMKRVMQGYTLAESLVAVTKDADLKEAYFITPVALKYAAADSQPNKWQRFNSNGSSSFGGKSFQGGAVVPGVAALPTGHESESSQIPLRKVLYLFAGRKRHSDVAAYLREAEAAGKIRLILKEFDIEVDDPRCYLSMPKFDKLGFYKGPLPRPIGHNHKHKLIGKTGDRWNTSPSAAYPPQMCKFIATLILNSCGRGSQSHGCQKRGLKRTSTSVPSGEGAGKKHKVADSVPSVTSAGAADSLPSVTTAAVGGTTQHSEQAQPIVVSDDERVPVDDEEQFDMKACCNAGAPIQVEWDQIQRGFTDGFGLCSPTRWKPSQRGERRDGVMVKLADDIFKILEETVLESIPDIRRAAFEVVTGKLERSPFSEGALNKLRDKWFALLSDKADAAVVDEGQPFYLRALAQWLKVFRDPDVQWLVDEEDSFSSGVFVGVGQPLPRSPQVFLKKLKHRKLDETEFNPFADNYPSAQLSSRELEEKFREEEGIGRTYPSRLGVLKQEFGDRLRVAAMAAITKPDGLVRPLHDAAHSVMVNHEIVYQDKIMCPGPPEIASVVRETRESGEAAFCVSADIKAAHRLVKIKRADWGLLCCKADSSSDTIWVNCNGTFGVSSAPFWASLGGLLGISFTTGG